MKRAILTPKMCFAAGQDAGNKNMRKHGRERWNGDDWNVAVIITNNLLLAIGDPEEVTE